MHPQTEKEIIIIFIAGIILFLFMIGYVINFLFLYQRKKRKHQGDTAALHKSFEESLMKTRFEIQEQVFQQIGKELHDNVGQLLSTSRMLIGLTERELHNPPDTLLTANATLGQAINEIRSLAKSLDKEWLERFSFSENIQTMIERINAGKTIEVEYVQSVELPLRSDEQIILFRIVQEAIQNAVKHAAPSHMRIAVEQEENNYLLTVSDDGKGFDLSSVSKSMGLANMQHRVQLLQGTVQFNSIPDVGTTVSIRLPVNTNKV